ncbi:MAG: phosphoglycerate dehydrogenase [Pseudomonadota bacterium]
MKKIAITTTSFGEYDKTVLEPLAERGCEVVFNPYGRKLKKEEISDLYCDVIGIIAGTETIDDEVMGRLPRLRVISRCGTGMDNVDLEAAKRKGIKVFNTPDAPTLAVAELTIGLMLDMLRRITMTDREIRSGVWHKHMGNLINGKSVGIVGFGRIGRKVAELLIPFGCAIRYYDIIAGTSETEIIGAHIDRLEMDSLLRISDIVTIHVSSQEQVLGRNEIGKIKRGAWLVNVSRGGVVDEEALYEALKNDHLSGAALDVFMEEPYKGPFTELKNVLLTAHIGSYAKESRIEMERQSVMNLLKGLE